MEVAGRQPQLQKGERQGLVVIGDFEDQQDVLLIGSYLTYTSSAESVLTVDASGILFGQQDGYAAVTARRTWPRQRQSRLAGQKTLSTFHEMDCSSTHQR